MRTDSIPFSAADLLSYSSLVRMIWPLPAFRLNMNLPLGLFFRSGARHCHHSLIVVVIARYPPGLPEYVKLSSSMLPQSHTARFAGEGRGSVRGHHRTRPGCLNSDANLRQNGLMRLSAPTREHHSVPASRSAKRLRRRIPQRSLPCAGWRSQSRPFGPTSLSMVAMIGSARASRR